ncbi:hypothetical protein [Streptomyces sp. NPDC050388]|uniref:hypothetical protein n=1 Tax=Streptomyces sp. NPDC050388 TaxID=3155781 RepID=UPI003418D2EC
MLRSDRSPLLLAGLPAVAVATRFTAPRRFAPIVPRSPPGSPRAWTYASDRRGARAAAGAALPQTRKAAASATAAFFVGVFPAQVTMAVEWSRRPTPQRAAARGRLLLQVPLVLWACGIARGT